MEEAAARAPLSLEQLIALNEEILALARAGMPLERGMLDLGADLPGRLRGITNTLGQRMRAGETLSDALAASGGSIPTVYRAVVEAGVKSGRLAVALEGLATYARDFVEARRSIALAIWYPLLVLCLAYLLLIFIMTTVIPRFNEAFVSLQLPADDKLQMVGGRFLGERSDVRVPFSIRGGLELADQLGRNVWYWGPVLPVILAVGACGWIGSRRAGSLQAGSASGFLRWFPWMKSMMRGYEAASFADLLALLIEHQVPYPDALLLAGDASGDAAMSRDVRSLSEALARGQTPAEALSGGAAFPPLLRWVLATAPQQGDLVNALRQMAARYRSVARHHADKLRVFLPTILLFAIGATATLAYALAVFVPLTALWTSLAAQSP